MHVVRRYDVGMNSMVAMELKALAALSLTAFDPPRQADHDLLMARFNQLSAGIREHLWDNESGIFVNRYSTVNNGSFYRRISPTSFYPMQAGIATEVRRCCHTLPSKECVVSMAPGTSQGFTSLISTRCLFAGTSYCHGKKLAAEPTALLYQPQRRLQGE